MGLLILRMTIWETVSETHHHGDHKLLPLPQSRLCFFPSLQKPLSFTSACLSWFPWGCCSRPDTPARPGSRLRKQMVTVLYLWESFGDVSMPKLQFWEEEICCQNVEHNMGKCSEVAGLKSGAASAPWRNSSLHIPRLCKLSLRSGEARGFCFCIPPTTSLDLDVASGLFWSHSQCFYTMRGVVLAPLGCWIMDQSTLCCLYWHPRRSSSVVVPKGPSLLAALAKVSMITPWKTPRMHRQGDAGYVRVADDIKLQVITQQVAWLITWPVLLSGEEALDPSRLKEPVVLPQTCCAHLEEAA